MSSDSDKVVFDEAVTQPDKTVLFQSKKWTYINDNSSNGGVFTGQLQFNLNTLANLNQWSDLSQALIQFPVQLRITNTGTAATTTAVNQMMATIKNGFHQFVDSAQITIGGTTIQSAQIYLNTDTTFKILTEWSLSELHNWGPSLGIALDDYQLAPDGTSTYTSLDNVPLATSVSAVTGFTLPTASNPGFKARAQFINNTSNAKDPATTLNGIINNAPLLGKGSVNYTQGSVPVGSDCFTLMTLATVRLKDISDCCAKLPPLKGLKGFIYLNYSSGRYVFTTGASGAINGVTSATALYGHTHPGMLGTTGTGFGTTASSWQFTADVCGTAVNGCTVPFVSARIYVPYLIANPDVDRALTQTKSIRYLERFVTSFYIDRLQSFSGTISPGIVNPKRVTLIPMLIGDSANGATSGSGTLVNLSTAPEVSATSHEPSGTGPFAALSGLQIIVGGLPMFQSPLQMDWESFQTEVVQMGLDGGLNPEQGSGLLNQRLWNSMYRYYTVDVSRRFTSEDGASKSVIVQCTNQTYAKMRVIAHIWYEREITVDTGMGQIRQGI
ncbi:hypothetical protein L914_21495 [Phytophthora nicotianae]|uniref:Uncharacterized protein n=2 Tax=Phytophthora nicotianae TaxID=4792 RepID=V9DT76_PHYNI|nr:hypothetical protein F443_22778 [Phytophthora nicotianae P1569]ETM30829.1 hypothetical protein L914_21495 [Phytophthora nicotianae]